MALKLSFRSSSIMTFMLVISALYAAQAITGSMVQTALPAVFRAHGMSLENIGFLSIVFLPWALKVFWAPFVDRIGKEHNWIFACQLFLIVCFVVLSQLPPERTIYGMVAVLMLMAFFAATQDIATDAFGVHATTEKTRWLASGVSTVGGYLGFVLGGGLWLIVYARSNWMIAMLTMAAVMVVLTMISRYSHRVKTSVKRSTQPRLRASFKNSAVVRGMLLLLLWQGAVRLSIAMASPLMVDAGISLELIGWIRGVGGMMFGLVAAIAGMLLVRRFGIAKILVLAGSLLIIICVGVLSWIFSGSTSQNILIALQLVLSGVVALSFVALYAAMMNWSNSEQTATDFALMQSIDTTLAIVAGILGGILAEKIGYEIIYVAVVIMMLGGIFMVNSPIRKKSLETENSLTGAV